MTPFSHQTSLYSLITTHEIHRPISKEDWLIQTRYPAQYLESRSYGQPSPDVASHCPATYALKSVTSLQNGCLQMCEKYEITVRNHGLEKREELETTQHPPTSSNYEENLTDIAQAPNSGSRWCSLIGPRYYWEEPPGPVGSCLHALQIYSMFLVPLVPLWHEYGSVGSHQGLEHFCRSLPAAVSLGAILVS